MPAKEFRQYLLLAEELKCARERKSAAIHSQRLREELKLDNFLADDHSNNIGEDGTALVKPSVILKQLQLLEISLEDWERVTKSAGISDLLKAARSLKALELGLPKDATEEQIKKKQREHQTRQVLEERLEVELSKQNLLEIASKTINEILKDPRAHTHARAKDGSVSLTSVDIDLGAGVVRQLSKGLQEFSLGLNASIALSASAATVWAIVGSELGFAAKLISGIYGPVCALLAGGFAGDQLAILAVKRVFWPLASRKFMASVTSSPPMQKVTKELEVIGVKCDTYLNEDEEGAKLVIRLYLPGSGRSSD